MEFNIFIAKIIALVAGALLAIGLFFNYMDKQRKLILAEIELKTYEHKQQETQRFEQIIDKQKTPNTTLPEKKGEVPNYLKRFELSVPLMLPDNKPVDDTYFIPDYPYYNIDGITDFEQEVY